MPRPLTAFRRPVGPSSPSYTASLPSRGGAHVYNVADTEGATRLVGQLFGGRVYGIRAAEAHGDTSGGFTVLYRTGSWDRPQERELQFDPFRPARGDLGSLAAVVTLANGRTRSVKHLCWLLAKKQHTRVASFEVFAERNKLVVNFGDGTKYETDYASNRVILNFLDRPIFAGRPLFYRTAGAAEVLSIGSNAYRQYVLTTF